TQTCKSCEALPGVGFASIQVQVGSDSGGVELLHENLPEGQEKSCDDGAHHEAVQSEQGQAAEGGKQHQIVRQLGISPDQDRAQDVINQANHEGSEQD